MILKKGDDNRLINSITSGAIDTYHVSVRSRTDVEHLDRTIKSIHQRQPQAHIVITIVESALGDSVIDYLESKGFYQSSKGSRAAEDGHNGYCYFVYKQINNLFDRLYHSVGQPLASLAPLHSD